MRDKRAVRVGELREGGRDDKGFMRGLGTLNGGFKSVSSEVYNVG